MFSSIKPINLKKQKAKIDAKRAKRLKSSGLLAPTRVKNSKKKIQEEKNEDPYGQNNNSRISLSVSTTKPKQLRG